MKSFRLAAAVLAAVVLAGATSGCADMNRRETNTAIGASVGAAAGAILSGGNAGATLIGAAAGGVLGNQVRR